MAASDKVWHYEQVNTQICWGYPLGIVLMEETGKQNNIVPQVKIKDSEYAKKCGIAGDCYFYVSKVITPHPSS